MMHQATLSQGSAKNLQITETLLVLAASVLIQFIIHLIPPVNGVPLGQVLLPVFYAPLIALVLYRMHVSLIAGILAPAVNYMITGAPRPELLALLTMELVLFVAIAGLLIHFGKALEFTALISIIITKMISFVINPLFIDNWMNSNNFFNSIVLAVPGILLLSLLNILLVRYKGRE